MTIKFSPSVNIIRDSERDLNYIVTPNAERVAKLIDNEFKQGFHSFNIIGSYGTGKSSFLWAIEQSLKGNNKYFNFDIKPSSQKVSILHFVGEYQSIVESFANKLNVENKLEGNHEIFDSIYQKYEDIGGKDGLLVIIIDELGKYLEFAAKNNPEKELYFIQQLAEFVDDKNRNILFISTIHQSFVGYANSLDESQRNEWIKIKGRLRELIFLASQHFTKFFESENKLSESNLFIKLNKSANIFSLNDEFAQKINGKIYPLDIFSACTLTIALQQYGQNERSLFTFLETADHLSINEWKPTNTPFYSVANVFDYLYFNFYTLLSYGYKQHLNHWRRIKSAIERVEDNISNNIQESVLIIKTIGLLNLFGKGTAQIDNDFLTTYGKHSLGISDVGKILVELERKKIIYFSKYSNSYKLYEGSDLDIDEALVLAENRVEEVTDIADRLSDHFDFPYITAKSVSYIKGTPRNFEFVISEMPISKIPSGSVDGYINLIINEKLHISDIKKHSENENEAILFGYYINAKQIRKTLFDIEKTENVIAENQEDIVAINELKNILEHQKRLLNHFVLDDLFTDKIIWFSNGNKKSFSNRKALNQLLSEICNGVYTATPTYLNELLNKSKIHSNISTARKYLFKALVNNWEEPDLGFDKNKFPAEKTIYLTLLQENGIHRSTNNRYELGSPNPNSTFVNVWNACEEFMLRSRQEKRKLSELIDVLSKRPFKLKQGLIDFWIPIFLFIKRGDYALYDKEIYVPFVNETKLYEITRNPQFFELKSFEITGLRLRVFNKYREFLKQDTETEFSNKAFIDSIRPFLTFYKNLPDYAKKSERMSEESISLRKAILNAKDPEKIFFEDFPAALKVSIEQLDNTEKSLAEFAFVLNRAINEIKNAYGELVNRIEGFITSEIVGKKSQFPLYKKHLQDRFSSIKEHQLLTQQKVFLQRINSPLNDRDSWIASIAQAVFNKPLEQITDNEEQTLKDKLLFLVTELDNLREISQDQNDTNDEIIKIDITSVSKGLRTNIIQIPKSKKKEVEQLVNEIKAKLKTSENISKAVLIKLLNESLNNE